MAELTNPSEIARETLRRLAMSRTPPTPDNYLRIYHEIAGSTPTETAFPEAFVRQLARQLPRNNAERTRLARQLEQALAARDASGAQAALNAYFDQLSAEETPAWNELIPQLIRQWEGRQLGWTTARKRDSLNRVLNAGDSNALFARLQALLRAWDQAPIDPELPAPELEAHAPTPATLVTGLNPAPTLTAAGTDDGIAQTLRDLLLLTLQSVVPAFLADHPELIQDAGLIADLARRASDSATLAVIGQQLRKFAHRIEMTAGEAAEVRAGLLELLRLLLQNIDELVLDDQWLQGQIAILRDIVDKPATPRIIDDAEQRLKEVIYKQSQLKHNLVQAQAQLKAMLAGFVDQLASFAASTGSYHDKMGACAQRISAARDITEIGPLLDEVMAETRSIQIKAEQSRGELVAAQQRAMTAEAQITAMQQALDEASRLVRHDQLTGALNRRGLEEVFQREIARCERYQCTACLALLDIDNFKRLNDTLGHQVGDEALVQLTRVVREHLRPQDTLARYGGEEFVIILPDTELEQAEQALVRLQRELTRAFFMAGEQRVVVTFSAGVTPRLAGEHLEQVLTRADAAMYEAKQAGKNRVVTRDV